MVLVALLQWWLYWPRVARPVHQAGSLGIKRIYARLGHKGDMMSKEAMKLALEALELINLEFVCANGSHHAKKDRHEWDEDCPITDRWRKAITALREASAEQPAQQEPVACSVCDQVHLILDGDESKIIRNAKDGYPDGRSPRILTLQERVMALCRYASDWKRWCLEKENTSPPAQQEPVTWGVDWGKAGDIPCVSIIKRLPGGGIEVVAVEYAP